MAPGPEFGAVGGGGNRVGAGDFLAIGLRLFQREPLAGNEAKAGGVDFELDVLSELRQWQRARQVRGYGLESHQVLDVPPGP